MATKRAPTTHAEHHVQHMRKQIIGFRAIIGELQKALKLERVRAQNAETRAEAAEAAFDLACWVAQQVLEQRPDSLEVNCWQHRFPGILTQQEEGK